MLAYGKAARISLKSDPEYSEKWLQQKIAEDVGILGLGDLDVKELERRQPRAGRLDLLLFDPEFNTRYEVEIQLGATDESHIIRTLEYWDNERRRFPQYEHVAVIVAEEVTGRFLNVINLFNQAIPLIAIQLSALRVGDMVTLAATRVLDLALPAPEEDDEPGQETNRAYWEGRSTPEIVGLVDDLLAVVNDQGEAMSLKYNKHYIGLQRDGMTDLFQLFRPRRGYLLWEVRLPQSDELDALIEDSGLTAISYEKRWGKYRFQIHPEDLTDNREMITALTRRSRGLPEEPAGNLTTLAETSSSAQASAH
jgi:hypothetical protein